MKKNFSKLMMIVLMAILPLSFYAQKKQTKPVEKYFYLQAEGGLSVNHTDVANYGFVPFYQNGAFVLNDGYVFNNFDGKLGLGYQLGKVMGINAKFGTATLAGEKHGQELNGVDATAVPTAYAAKGFNDVKFDKTTFMEGNLNLTFNFFNLFFGYNPRRVFNFIPHIGVGGIGFVAGEVSSQGSTTTPDGTTILAAKTKADREWALTVPVGAELNFNLARKLDFFIDYTFTWAGSDGLDQVKKWPNDDIQVVNDMYSSVNAGLRLKFNKKPCDIERMAAEANDIAMRTNPDPLEEKDGKVCFDVIFTIPAEYFEKEAVMNITPTFTYKGGEVELEPVTFVGEKAEGGDFQVSYKNGGEFTKHYCMDYAPEMESGKLVGNPMFYVYNGKIYPTQDEIVKNAYFTQGGDRVITEGVLVPVVKCEVSNINTVVDGNNVMVSWTGDAESYDLYFGEGAATTATVSGVTATKYTFTDVEAGDYNVYVKANCKNDNYGEWQQGPAAKIVPERKPVATLQFKYQKSDVSEIRMNKDLIKSLVEMVAAGKAPNGFEIEGWASPENGDHNNDKLSADRANNSVAAIKKALGKAGKDLTFEATGNGSDWTKFIELLQTSNIADKDQIIRVIQNSRNPEQEIENLRNVYDLEEVFAPLRRAEIYIK